MIDFSVETPDDWHEVEYLYDLTFAPGRTALSSYRLRDGVDPVADLCFVGRDGGGVLAAAVRNWPVCVGPAGHAALLLGPISVHPTRQGEGLGAALMAHCLDEAAAAGWERVILIGDAPYYGRFGFVRLDAVTFPPPTNPERVLGQALAPGGLDGVAGHVRKWPG